MSLIECKLTPLFRSNINLQNYSDLAEKAGERIVGELPSDIRKVIVQEYPSGTQSESLNIIKEGYKKAVEALKNIEILQHQAYNRVPATDNTAKGIPDFMEDFDVSAVSTEDSTFSQQAAEYFLLAEDALIKSFSNIFPSLKNIIVSFIGEGNFSRNYKIEFKFNDCDTKVESQSLKVYRDKPLTATKLGLVLRLLKNMSNRTITELNKCGINDAKRERRNNIRDAYKTLDLVTSENYGENGHGAYAEANTTEYIRHMNSGNAIKPEDGLVLPDLFVLGENSFSISKFIPHWAKAKKSFDFQSLGLVHTDFDDKPDNGIGGICVDMGGIIPLTKEFTGQSSSIVGSKTGTKIMKDFCKLKTSKERKEFLKETRRKANTEKNLVRKREMLDAVEEIKSLFVKGILQ